MERIAAGKPPLILGDGSQTMDFVYIERRRAREHARRAGRRRPTRSSTSPAAIETSLAGAGPDAAAGDGLRPAGRVRARAGASTRCPRRLADTSRARELLGFEAEVGLEEGLRRLVEWWRAERDRHRSRRRSPRRRDGGSRSPVPHLDRRRGAGGRRGDRLGLGLPGTARRAPSRPAFAERVGAPDAVATTSCTTALAARPATSRASARATR